MCLAAISDGQLWIMAFVMVTNLVWHDPSNDTVHNVHIVQYLYLATEQAGNYLQSAKV